MTQRILLGKFPAGDTSPNGYGLRISQAGYDVTTPNPNNERLIFNSDWKGVLPIHISGTLSVSAGGTAQVSHNLGYIPFATALVNIGGRGWEQYQCANVCYRLTNEPTETYRDQSGNTQTAKELLTANPQFIYTYDGDRTTLAQYKVDTTKAYFYCTESAQIYYIVYRMKAF